MVTVSSERHELSWPKVVLSCGHSEERGCAFSTMAGRRGGMSPGGSPVPRRAEQLLQAALRSCRGSGDRETGGTERVSRNTSSRIQLLTDPG